MHLTMSIGHPYLLILGADPQVPCRLCWHRRLVHRLEHSLVGQVIKKKWNHHLLKNVHTCQVWWRFEEQPREDYRNNAGGSCLTG